MTIHPDAWLTETLGRPAFAATPSTAMPAQIASALASFQAPPQSFVTAKVGIGDLGAVHALLAAGFHLIETSLTFGRPIERHDRVEQVSPYDPRWREEVLRIAEHSFVHSRFHVDPQIGVEAANRVKREWIRSYTEGSRGDALLVAHDGDAVRGFNALLIAERPEGPAAIIDLIAVDHRHHGQGIGQRLVTAGLHQYQGRCRTMEVGTQASNLSSVRLYERAGFRLIRSGYVLHRHHREQCA